MVPQMTLGWVDSWRSPMWNVFSKSDEPLKTPYGYSFLFLQQYIFTEIVVRGWTGTAAKDIC